MTASVVNVPTDVDTIAKMSRPPMYWIGTKTENNRAPNPIFDTASRMMG